MLSKELTGACSKPIILGIIARGESYGYQILSDLKILSEGRLEWAEGLLYPILRRLEQESLLSSRWVTPESGRRRRYYKITEKGKKSLIKEQNKWRETTTLLESIWSPIPINL